MHRRRRWILQAEPSPTQQPAPCLPEVRPLRASRQSLRRHVRPAVIRLDWTVYILRCADGTLYTGITNDLERRLTEHEAGQGAKYTKGRGPFQLVYQETCDGRGPASQRENQIKSLGRKAKLTLVDSKLNSGR